MDYKLLFDVAVLAGEVMAQSGAETYRVEDTVLRILKLANRKTAEVFVTMTGFCATLDNPDMDAMTVVRRIPTRQMNLSKIHEVNIISRQLCQQEIDFEEALKRLKKIKRDNLPVKGHYIAFMAVTAGFTMMLGGRLPESVLAGISGIISVFLINICTKYQVHGFLKNIICNAGIAILAVLGAKVLGSNYNMDVVIIGSIMPFVPGVAVTNAVFDTLHGDYLSGVARAVEAFVTAVSVAVGIGLGMALCQLLALR